MSSESASYVVSACRENDVKFIRLWFTDIVGSLKSFAITVEELEKALDEGMGFDGSSIEGFARIDESDMLAMPDPTTFQLVPWRPKVHEPAWCRGHGGGGLRAAGRGIRGRPDYPWDRCEPALRPCDPHSRPVRGHEAMLLRFMK